MLTTQQNNDNLDEKWIEYIIQFGENNVIDSLYKIIVNENEKGLNEEMFVEWYLSFC